MDIRRWAYEPWPYNKAERLIYYFLFGRPAPMPTGWIEIRGVGEPRELIKRFRNKMVQDIVIFNYKKD